MCALSSELMRPRSSARQVLILAPTREVALQSSDVAQRIAAALPEPAPACVAFVGGLPTVEDQKRLRRWVG
jgi:ATP-dependent RNA helicase DDX20